MVRRCDRRVPLRHWAPNFFTVVHGLDVWSVITTGQRTLRRTQAVSTNSVVWPHQNVHVDGIAVDEVHTRRQRSSFTSRREIYQAAAQP